MTTEPTETPRTDAAESQFQKTHGLRGFGLAIESRKLERELSECQFKRRNDIVDSAVMDIVENQKNTIDQLQKQNAGFRLVVDLYLAEGRPHGGHNTQFPDGCECHLCQNWDSLNKAFKL